MLLLLRNSTKVSLNKIDLVKLNTIRRSFSFLISHNNKKLRNKTNHETNLCYLVTQSSKIHASTTTRSESTRITSELPKSTKVVICGGGLFGTSVAYHLGKLGFKDVVLVTRDKYLAYNYYLFCFSDM
jgi:hypothetical protein